EAAEARFNKVKDKRFTLAPFKVKGRSAAFVALEDYWESRVFHYQWIGSGMLALAIVRNKTGHVVIQSSSWFRILPDLKQLYMRLAADEKDAWYLHDPGGKQTLLNGGFRYDGEKVTKKPAADLMRLASKYVTFSK
ncbi:MAG TPA: hypothetical protein VE973_02335, partial [Candidatus Limnocylindria bacterium]|nr:hypothetical protein [Candidatus Limnocylindria bacterium]